MPCVGFEIKWKDEDLEDVISRERGGELEHSIRLWEHETAVDMNMRLEKWYRLPLIEREQLVATRIADKLIDYIQSREEIKKYRKG